METVAGLCTASALVLRADLWCVLFKRNQHNTSVNSLASSHCFHVAKTHQAIVRSLSGRALLQSPEAPWVPILSPHQLPGVWDKHSLPRQGNNETLVMQSLLGGPWGASWPHLEHSYQQAMGEGGPGWAQVGKQSSWRESPTAGCVFTSSGSVQVPCCSVWLTDAHFLSASRFQIQTWLETFQSVTPGTLSFQKEDSHWLCRDFGWTLALSLFKESSFSSFFESRGRCWRAFVTTS